MNVYQIQQLGAQLQSSTVRTPKQYTVRKQQLSISAVSGVSQNNVTQTQLAGLQTEKIRNAKEIENHALYRQMELCIQNPNGLQLKNSLDPAILADAYKQCGELTKEYGRTFYFGTIFMTKEKARRVWAIYQWCRRTDEIVDGPNSNVMLHNEMSSKLDEWEDRLEKLFDGKPVDPFDAVLTDTLSQCSLDIQPFKDMIEGMRMDLYKKRYNNFDELYEYCYRVAGTVGLMSAPIMGVDPSAKNELEPVYRAALALGHANQLTNIIRDVGADKDQLNRIYVPLDELDQFGIKERDLESANFKNRSKQLDESWQNFMKFQIVRARKFFSDSESGVYQLNKDARWPVMTALDLYSRILNKVEQNQYDNITKRAFVPSGEKISRLPLNLFKSQIPASWANQFQKSTMQQSSGKRIRA